MNRGGQRVSKPSKANYSDYFSQRMNAYAECVGCISLAEYRKSPGHPQIGEAKSCSCNNEHSGLWHCTPFPRQRAAWRLGKFCRFLRAVLDLAVSNVTASSTIPPTVFQLGATDHRYPFVTNGDCKHRLPVVFKKYFTCRTRMAERQVVKRVLNCLWIVNQQSDVFDIL